METSNVVILGLVVVLLVGGGYVVSRNSSSNAVTGSSLTAVQKEAQMNDQLANDEAAKKAAADTMAADEKGGVMVGGAMMMPSLTIVDNAMKASNVTTAVAAIKAAGLVDTLKGPGPFTVFAPTNAAFTALPAGTVDMLLKPENKAKLVNILQYHVVPGRYMAADLMDGQQLKTIQGQELTITKKDSKLMVNGSTTVETADVASSNGVTFVVNGVLMPK